ncbi:hypothetical protein [Rheinheimera sp.]|uniref:hypothetical protein n=1 Tax=Rheinheimera sp. TaxID=1869214 RepID=UPI0037C855AC
MKSLKLFIAIFLGVYLANIASHLTLTHLWAEAINQLTKEMFSDKPKQRNTSGLQADLERLAKRPPGSLPNKPTQTNTEALNAKEVELKHCEYWINQYFKDNSKHSKLNMDEACKRVKLN